MVLMAGGLDASGSLASAELYDPTTGTFTSTGNMTVTRYRHTATLLNNGKVLIVGGELSATGSPSPLASAELYDPLTATFASTGSMTTGRFFHTATMLNNGKVLVTAGEDPNANGVNFLASAELYDPGSGTSILTGSLNNAREEHSATLLNDGTVLIVGGNNGTGGVDGFVSAELYDSITGTFTTTGNPNTARSGQTAALLNTGKVLIASGYVPGGNELTSAELYDPGTTAFTYTGSMTTAREFQRASMLNDGTVLITGGLGNGAAIASTELYDPVSGLFTSPGSMISATYWHTSTLLNNGNALLAGGNSLTPSLSELYVPGTLSPKELVSISLTPEAPTLSVEGTLQFIATGTFSDNTTQVLQSVIWSSSNTAAATISNDASNHGVALAVAVGSSTITASAGSVSGSTALTVQ
jgi:Bacterial Ig-like domain (group 2)